MADINSVFEEIKVQGKELGDKIGEIVHAGNVRRIIVKNESGHTMLEIPLTLATIGVILAPVLAAVGALGALIADCTIVVERTPEPPKAGPPDGPV
jgi:hypothetical protein